MLAAMAGLLGIVVGLVGGYFVRRHEWLRERRLDIYSDFIGAFLGLVEASMAAAGLYVTFGDQMLRKPEWHEISTPFLNEVRVRLDAFDVSTARVHLISDESTFKAATAMEAFVINRINKLPPSHDPGTNPFVGFQTVREDANKLLGDFLRPASKHAGVKAKGAKDRGLGVLATSRDNA